MKILIVDDHILFQEGLIGLLDNQPDFTVVGGASSVQEAVKKARQLLPDVILMDFTLPDGTGLDATQTILAERPSTQIIFLTIHEEDDRLFEAIRYGARGYLLKEIPANQLIAYLRGVQRGEPAITPHLTANILKEFAKTQPRQDIPQEVMDQLTNRQLDVLRELRSGASNQQIANRLVLSEQTVKNHVSRILHCLNLKNRYEAAEFARRYDL
ncbi:MAG: response regulator transcription factor [Anaerolineaceae bacterium]|nr:response regulator transcription factor [Anaerolineaceae bacterium]